MLDEADADPVRVLIVDDHLMFVDSLVRLLRDESDVDVIGVAHTMEQAVQSLQALEPDVVLLDFRLPDGDAPSLIARSPELAPNARVVVMTGLEDDATMAAARESGCAGIVTKQQAAHDLVAALRAAAARERSEPGPVPARRSELRVAGADHGLSAREREVLAQLAAGRSTADIAETLHISSVTVRNHIQRILSKLDARSRLEAVAVGMRAGIIGPPPPRR